MKTKILCVVTALAIAMTSFVSLTITASADDYYLECNGEPVNEGDSVYPWDILQSNKNISLYINYGDDDEWFEGYSIELPDNCDEYNVDTIEYDEDEDVLSVSLSGLGEDEPVPGGDEPVGCILTCNGGPIEVGDTLHSGDVITTNADKLMIYLDYGLDADWVYMDDDGQHTYTLPGTDAEFTVFDVGTGNWPEDVCVILMAVPVNSVSLSKSDISLLKGETQSLSVTVLPGTAFDKSVTWTSSDASVASVDENGLVTAVAAGVVTITASSNMTSGKSASCTVTVTAPPSTAEISVEDVDAYIDNQGFGHLRVISKVLFENKDVEYYGAWFIPADLQDDDNYEKAQVTVSAEIESGDTFASDLRNIPAESNERSILVIPFIKLCGEENLATTFSVLTVSGNKNETSK